MGWDRLGEAIPQPAHDFRLLPMVIYCCMPELSREGDKKIKKKGGGVDLNFRAQNASLHLKGSSFKGTSQFANREQTPIGSPFFRACRRSGAAPSPPVSLYGVLQPRQG